MDRVEREERVETQADVLAEMRKIRIREFQDFADRIEAAAKREMSKRVSKNGADFGQFGNRNKEGGAS